MATKTLLSQTGQVGSGSIVFFSETDNVRTIQINPNINTGFSGSINIEGSYAASPGANDFVTIASITMAGHQQNMTIDIKNSSPNIRATVVTSNQGEVAVFGDSRVAERLSGGSGSGPASAIISSSSDTAVVGNNVRIEAPIVPSITSDDVVYANDFAFTVTDKLDGKQDKLSGTVSPNLTNDDLNVLAGMFPYGLTQDDMKKLADVTVSASELNQTIGATSPLQDQINTLTTGYVKGTADLTGLNATVAEMNLALVGITASASEINGLAGMTASAADLNGLTGTAGTFNANDLIFLSNININGLSDLTNDAAIINNLVGWVGNANDLNKLDGLTASTNDLNAITGLELSGVTATELAHLAGLTENAQAAIDKAADLVGLTADVADLNLLTGAATGAGAYSGSISATEISYLDGLGSNIQNQLDEKRNLTDTIGISEITHASITTVELNYLQSVRGNVQVQIDGLLGGVINVIGGSMTGQLNIADGSAAVPGLGYDSDKSMGLYKSGLGIGLAVGGKKSATLENNNWAVGENQSINPVMHGYTSPVNLPDSAVFNPAFTFEGDTASGMYSLGTGIVGISSTAKSVIEVSGGAILNGSKVSLGNDVSINTKVVVDGIFGGEKMLGKVSIKAGATAGAPDGIGTKLLYKVPIGRTAVVSKVMVILTNVVNATWTLVPGNDDSMFRLNVGWEQTVAPIPPTQLYDQIVDNVVNDGIFNPGAYLFNTAGQVMPLGVGADTFPAVSGESGSSYGILTSDAELLTNVLGLALADNYDMDVIAFGYEY